MTTPTHWQLCTSGTWDQSINQGKQLTSAWCHLNMFIRCTLHKIKKWNQKIFLTKEHGHLIINRMPVWKFSKSTSARVRKNIICTHFPSIYKNFRCIWNRYINSGIRLLQKRFLKCEILGTPNLPCQFI